MIQEVHSRRLGIPVTPDKCDCGQYLTKYVEDDSGKWWSTCPKEHI